MALAQCKECGAQVSKRAKICPSCGAPKPGDRGSIVYTILVIVIVAGIAYTWLTGRGKPPEPVGTTSAPAPIVPGGLGLAKADKHLMPYLEEAARLAARSGQCVAITEGSKSSSRSKPNHPVFYITCQTRRGSDPRNFRILYYTKGQIDAALSP